MLFRKTEVVEFSKLSGCTTENLSTPISDSSDPFDWHETLMPVGRTPTKLHSKDDAPYDAKRKSLASVASVASVAFAVIAVSADSHQTNKETIELIAALL